MKDSFRSLKFYETIKKYRIESKTYLDEIKDSSREVNMANIAILQGQDQNQTKKTDDQEKGKSKSLKK